MKIPFRSTRLPPIVLLAGVSVAVATFTRAVLLFHPNTGTIGASAIVPFLIGFVFDLIVAVFACTPLLLLTMLAPNRLAATRPWRAAMSLLWVLAVYVLTVAAVAEWLFWEEFGGRFNFIAVDYLLYTREVWGNIRESYPVGPIFTALALPALLLAVAFRKTMWRGFAAPMRALPRVAIVATTVVLVYGLGRVADSDYREYSDLDAANELAGNGIFQFFAANRRNELPFEKHYAGVAPALALEMARRQIEADEQPGVKIFDAGVERVVPARVHTSRPPNIVLISIESMGAEFFGVYGNNGGLTPRLDRIARNSLWFSNVFATGNRTVRGLEALTLSLPPTPGQSIVRRPKNGGLFSLGSVFEDNHYEVYYAYGGYGYFDNMNAFFGDNDYHIIDRADIPKERAPFANIWGVADEFLFEHMLAVLDVEHERNGARSPFFAHMMTVSNHRPYTYPDGRVDIPSGSGRDGAVKYSDYAVGKFLDDARRHPWFKDTIFVVTADHGANARGTLEIPIDKYRIPVFFYAPGRIAPQKVERLMSQIDIAPTALGFTGLPYYSKFLGRDMMRAKPGSDRAFVANYQTLGYLRDGKLVTLQPKKKVRVARVDADGKVIATIDDPALAQEAAAFYQAASYLFRSGLYADEEQLPPAQRVAARAEHGRTH